MPTIELIHPDGNTYSLSDGNPFAVIDEENGMATIRRITERGPLQHGDSDRDFRLDPTIYPLGLLMYAADIATHYNNRQLATHIFRPSKAELKLRWTLENGAVRQFDVHVDGRIAFGSKDARGFSQRFVVPLRAADPTCYDPTLNNITYGVGGGTGAWSFPLSFPGSFGGSTINQTRTIPYVGTWRSSPIVLIKGPITNPVITNLNTGDKLDFTGVTVNSGDTYTIDCRPGRGSVNDSTGVDKIADLTDDSDITTFSLEADAEAPGGLNDVKVTGTSANATTEVYLQWYTRYIGF